MTDPRVGQEDVAARRASPTSLATWPTTRSAPGPALNRAESQRARFAAGPGAAIEIYGAPGAGIDDRTRVAGVSLGLKVDDVDAEHERLTAGGVECMDPEDQWWGGRLFYVFDPNGLSILVSQTKALSDPT